MAAFIVRVLIAALAFWLVMMIIPLFCETIGVAMSGAGFQLLRVCVAALAILYVFFGPNPPTPNWGTKSP